MNNISHKPLIPISIFLVFLFSLQCQFRPGHRGKQLYETHCSSCHMKDGEGLGFLYPSLVSSDYTVGNQADELPCIIRHGIKVKENDYMVMPSNADLSSLDIANIINYIRHQLCAMDGALETNKSVNDLLNECIKNDM